MKVMSSSISLPLDRVSAVRSNVPSSIAKSEQKSEQVKLSSEGLSRTDDQQATISLHTRMYRHPTLAERQHQRFTEIGKQAFLQLEPPEDYSAEEVDRYRQALMYLAKRFNTGNWSPSNDSPFWGLSRDQLVAIEEDEQNYTELERYAAHRVKKELDYNYFTALGAQARGSGDTRPLLKGYHEYLQHLSPAERLNYPVDEEARVTAELALREQEFGAWPEGLTLWDLFDWYSPDNRGLLAQLAVRDDGEQTTSPPMEGDA